MASHVARIQVIENVTTRRRIVVIMVVRAAEDDGGGREAPVAEARVHAGEASIRRKGGEIGMGGDGGTDHDGAQPWAQSKRHWLTVSDSAVRVCCTSHAAGG